MKKIFFLFIITSLHFTTYSQNLDLIVTNNGDSIACRIDSVNSSKIFFKMITKNEWMSTHIAISKIKEHQKGIINRKQYKFKPGTSFISGKRKYLGGIYDVQRNSISLETILIANYLNYEALIPLSKRSGISVGAGLNYHIMGGVNISIESNFLYGGIKHFFEAGLRIYPLYGGDDEVDETWDLGKFGVVINDIGIYPNIGYRFQGTKGFLFKAKVGVYPIDGPLIAPMFSFGYSF